MSLTLADMDNYMLSDLDQFTLDELDHMSAEELATRVKQAHQNLSDSFDADQPIPDNMTGDVIELEKSVCALTKDNIIKHSKNITIGLMIFLGEYLLSRLLDGFIDNREETVQTIMTYLRIANLLLTT